MTTANWRWFGYPGHFAGALECAFRMTTRVGTTLVSTVGDWRPNGISKTLEHGRKFETCTFDVSTGHVNEAGVPEPASWAEITCKKYDDPAEAAAGHIAICREISDAQLVHSQKMLNSRVGLGGISL